MATHILVVDDETAIADLVEVYLKNEGFTIHKFYNASDALACVRTTRLNLAVLDVMLPDMDGFTLCQRIREDHLFPIIMLTAKVEDMDKITGLTLGADDYITKPFNPLELVARVKTQLRRYTRYNPREGTVQEVTEYDFRGLQISKATHKCVLFGEELALTPLEFSILWYLCEHRGNVVSSEELFEHVWGEAFMDSNNTVMSHIARLREKMHEPSRKPNSSRPFGGWGTPLSKKGNTRSRRRSLRIWGGYLLVLMAWVVAVMALAFLASSSAPASPGSPRRSTTS